jgi:hypothetical protein
VAQVCDVFVPVWGEEGASFLRSKTSPISTYICFFMSAIRSLAGITADCPLAGVSVFAALLGLFELTGSNTADASGQRFTRATVFHCVAGASGVLKRYNAGSTKRRAGKPIANPELGFGVNPARNAAQPPKTPTRMLAC